MSIGQKVVVADCRQAFAGDPPAISGVAIMTDERQHRRIGNGVLRGHRLHDEMTTTGV